MIYMVEMALLDTARRAEWEAWYVAHQHKLLSIPGIHASQRFEALHKAESPFVALHEVDSPEVFTSPSYRAQAGPTNTGEWQTRMDNWHRNVFDGLARPPDVSMDSCLLVVEAHGGPALPSGVPVDPHFVPRYEPWDQRLCVVPDGDLFAALRNGTAEIVTGTIETFTDKGIRLTDGTELPAHSHERARRRRPRRDPRSAVGLRRRRRRPHCGRHQDPV